MRRHVVTLLALAAVTVALAPAEAKAAAPFVRCTPSTKVECARVPVPLDRTGVVQGPLWLHVERSVAPGLVRGVVLVLAGGPGQPGSSTFELAESARELRRLFPGYTLATYDPRGTGHSSPLFCPGLQLASVFYADRQHWAEQVGACGTLIGDSRRFYSTRDHAEDVEAVRQALGVDRIAIWGTSYGTLHATTYALAHPERVERLLLDSAIPLEGLDPLGTDMLRALPGALSSLCAGGACLAATPSFAADVVTLANRLATKPLRGKVRTAGGGTRAQSLDGLQLLDLALAADVSPGIAAELPAAVRAALRREPRPLLRLLPITDGGEVAWDSFNGALFAATVCDDGPFPWRPDTPIAERPPLVDAAIAALPAGATGPFGSWATAVGTAASCKLWPEQAAAPELAPRPLPDVPVLVLAGDRDTRTPVAGAASLAARFLQGRLLVVPGVGHAVLWADPTECAAREVPKWLAGSEPARSCKRARALVRPLGAFPRSLDAVAPYGRVHGLRGRVLGAVVRTVEEAGATWTMTWDTTPVPGLYAGSLVPSNDNSSFWLNEYSIVPGVQLTGLLFLAESDPYFPVRFLGAVEVDGPRGVSGRLQIRPGRISGVVGGQDVSAPL